MKLKKDTGTHKIDTFHSLIASSAIRSFFDDLSLYTIDFEQSRLILKRLKRQSIERREIERGNTGKI